MVELLHAVVAHVTVRSFTRPKHHAGLAEFKRSYCLVCEIFTERSLALIDQIKNALALVSNR